MDIKKRDQEAFFEELRRINRWGPLAGSAALSLIAIGWIWILLVTIPAMAYFVYAAWQASEKRRFRYKKFYYLWQNCLDRLRRLDEELAKARSAKVASLEELPKTVGGVSNSLYEALRRADNALHEVGASEGFRMSQPDTAPPKSFDPEAAKLWGVEMKTKEEYRNLLRGILAGAERTEAQAAVFIATLDSLRAKVLGYRLAGGGAKVESVDLVRSLTEARMQLDSIDKALDELELTPFPSNLDNVEVPSGDSLADFRRRLDEMKGQRLAQIEDEIENENRENA